MSELTPEELETWEALLKVYAPEAFDTGYFYCPYVPNFENEIIGYIKDVS